MISQTDPFGLTLAYGYDGNGNVISVADSLGALTTSLYDADKRLTMREFQGRGHARLRIDFTYRSFAATNDSIMSSI
jgi:YD repeat-containing protein